ncbi:hypothetical protein COB11_03710 [Candidatus Aerophobetes bacterium]|uniref:DUF2764 family protein n=1 Tax=Aerophobetes bacterium TaxID=2030807 RepID=A0A2A4YIL5_UNCAE|nr:MAG: hypothetical protein COB11_03710 [Candidatus Aerophobetes bacterium]
MTYYYISSALTPLEYGDTPDMTFHFLFEKYKENLSESDMKQLSVLRKKFDLMNIKRLLRHEEIDTRGNLDQKELEEALSTEGYFDQYVFDFLNRFDEDADKILNFPELLNRFFIDEEEKASGFLKNLLGNQRKWRLILTGYRTKKQKGDISKQLSFEDPFDPITAMILSQKDSPHFEAPEGSEELSEMLMTTKESPMQQFRRFAEFRFRKIKEIVEDRLFSLDYLIAYAVQVIILEDLHALSKEEGEKVLNTIVKDTS